MKINLGKISITIAEKLLAVGITSYVAWMVWVTSSLYGQAQDIALIKQLVSRPMTQLQIESRADQASK